jgi:hypothetical protein
MANFLLIYTGGWGMPDDEAGQAEVKAAWGAWFGKMGSAVVGGESLGAGRSVTPEGNGDGPAIAPSPSGYMVLTAESFDDAMSKVRDHPHVRFGGQLSIFETV